MEPVTHLVIGKFNLIISEAPGAEGDPKKLRAMGILLMHLSGEWDQDKDGELTSRCPLPAKQPEDKEVLVLDFMGNDDKGFLQAVEFLFIHHRVIDEDNAKRVRREEIVTKCLIDVCTLSFPLRRTSNGTEIYLGIGRKMVGNTASRCFYKLSEKRFPYGEH